MVVDVRVWVLDTRAVAVEVSVGVVVMVDVVMRVDVAVVDVVVVTDEVAVEVPSTDTSVAVAAGMMSVNMLVVVTDRVSVTVPLTVVVVRSVVLVTIDEQHFEMMLAAMSPRKSNSPWPILYGPDDGWGARLAISTCLFPNIAPFTVLVGVTVVTTVEYVTSAVVVIVVERVSCLLC